MSEYVINITPEKRHDYYRDILKALKDGGVIAWDTVINNAGITNERDFWFMIGLMTQEHLIYLVSAGRGMIGIRKKGLRIWRDVFVRKEHYGTYS